MVAMVFKEKLSPEISIRIRLEIRQYAPYGNGAYSSGELNIFYRRPRDSRAPQIYHLFLLEIEHIETIKTIAGIQKIEQAEKIENGENREK